MNPMHVISNLHVALTVDDMELIEAHLEWLESQPLAPITRYERERLLRWAAARLPKGLGDVHTHQLHALIFQRHFSPWTVSVYDGHLRAFYAWAHQHGEMSANPMLGIRRPPQPACHPKPVTAEEIRIALERSGEPWLTCIVLALGAGLRTSELATIEREDIDADYVHVRRGKGGKERWVDTASAVWEHVQPKPAGLLVHRDGRALTGHVLSAGQWRHWRRIGLPGWHLHRLRHTFATAMWQAGSDPGAIRDLMGHRYLKTTEGYAQVAHSARREAVAAVDSLLKPEAPASP